MSDLTELTPLRPRDFFALTWSGKDLWLRPDGFTFSPYQIMAAMPPLPFPLVIGAEDACEWDATRGELTDTLRLRLFGVPIGRMVMRLRPAPPAG